MGFLKAAKTALAQPDREVRVAELRALNEAVKAKRQTPVNPVTTYIPPPKTDITPALINESLSVQPQNTATISSVQIHIPDGKITFYFQLNGPVASTLAINASTSLPCGSIGTDPQPDISIVPKNVEQGYGEQQTVIPDCLCFAVNMYNPNIINFYVSNEQGKMFSLTGSNKIIDIDKLDTSQTLALDLVPIPAGSQKRSTVSTTNYVPLKARAIFGIQCGQPCPFPYMRHVTGSDGGCACIFSEGTIVDKRGVSAPDMYTSVFSKEACEAITCLETGKPARFNPLSLSCMCVDPAYIESNPSAWKAGS